MWLGILRWVMRPIERWSARTAATCWMVILTAMWLIDLRRRHRAWTSVNKRKKR